MLLLRLHVFSSLLLIKRKTRKCTAEYTIRLHRNLFTSAKRANNSLNETTRTTWVKWEFAIVSLFGNLIRILISPFYRPIEKQQRKLFAFNRCEKKYLATIYQKTKFYETIKMNIDTFVPISNLLMCILVICFSNLETLFRSNVREMLSQLNWSCVFRFYSARLLSQTTFIWFLHVFFRHSLFCSCSSLYFCSCV